MREFDDKCKSVLEHLQPIKKHLSRLSTDGAFDPKAPAREGVLASYRDKVEDNKKAWNMLSVAVPEVPTRRLLEMAISRAVAFENKGKNFQDTLVFLSMVAQVETGDGNDTAFVSRDCIFRERKSLLEQSAAREGVRLVIYYDLNSVAEDMRLREEESIRQLIALDKTAACHALQARTASIQEWLDARKREFLWVIPGTLNVGVWEIREIKVEKVISATPSFGAAREPQQRVSIAFVIEANIIGARRDGELIAATYYTLPQGDPISQPSGLYPRVGETRDFGSRLIEMEGEATFDGKTYVDFSFLGAVLRPYPPPPDLSSPES